MPHKCAYQKKGNFNSYYYRWWLNNNNRNSYFLQWESRAFDMNEWLWVTCGLLVHYSGVQIVGGGRGGGGERKRNCQMETAKHFWWTFLIISHKWQVKFFIYYFWKIPIERELDLLFYYNGCKLNSCKESSLMVLILGIHRSSRCFFVHFRSNGELHFARWHDHWPALHFTPKRKQPNSTIAIKSWHFFGGRRSGIGVSWHQGCW